MKLALRRYQQDIKGVFGGHKGVEFVLHVRAQLSPEEQGLIARYKLDDLILYEWPNPRDAEHSFRLRVSYLREGHHISLLNIAEMIDAEEQVKEGCRVLKAVLERASQFGGEEVIEI